jgi:hypothetical protein
VLQELTFQLLRSVTSRRFPVSEDFSLIVPYERHGKMNDDFSSFFSSSPVR